MKDTVIRVERYCMQQQLLVRGGRVLVALSGGADSVCLLYLLKQLQSKWQLQLAAAHLHHGLRGAEADADLVFVRELCHTLDISFYEKKVDVATFAKEQGCSVETAGRKLRYAFLEEAAQRFAVETIPIVQRVCIENQAEERHVRIATAHHKNDQAETVLMHLLRGSGGRGLAGILPKRNHIIRPLLCLTREEIEGYLKQNEIPFRTDSSNLCSDVTRNRVRLELLPHLAREYNPEIVETLCRTAEIMRQQQLEVDKQTERFLQTHVKQEGCGRRVEAETLLACGITVGHAVLCRIAGMELDWQHTQAIWQLLKQNKTGAQVDLPQNTVASLCYETLYIGPKEEKQQGFFYELRPGETCTIVEAGVIAGVEWTAEDENRQESAHIMPYQGKAVLIRSRQPGDRMRTGGKTQRVKQMMIDAKIPKNQRDRIPIVEVGGEVVWIVGLRHADAPPGGTQKIKIWIKERY